MSSLVWRGGPDECVSFPCEHDSKSPTHTYILGPKIFERVPGHLAGDGLTVYRARRADSQDENYAVKFKWLDDSGSNELKLLNLLKERNGWGVMRLDAYYVGANTEVLHDGLTFGNPLTLKLESGGSHDEIDEGMAELCSQDSRNEPKIFTCTVATPQGRSLHNYGSIPEVFFALRDAIRAHRSLYQDGRILH